ncbi:MAG: zinc ribbon domain-containing protein [Calditrichaeota bacterium]|nr:MAG: zinc ribbon domain-containing protein [Calditrichota bacterium]
MPTYEYRCKDCGHLFEEFQSIKDLPIEECPVCHGKAERLISGGSGLIFKGSGFYITDYQRKSNGTTNNQSSSRESSKTDKKNDSGSNASNK